MKKILGLLLGVLLIAGIKIPVQAAEDERTVKEYLESVLEMVEGTGFLSSDIEDAIHNYMDSEDVIPDNIEEKQVKEVVDYIKKKLETIDLKDSEEVNEAITEAEEKFQVTLSDEEKKTILGIIDKINQLGLDSETILAQIDKYSSQITQNAKETYEEYGSEVIEEAEEAVKETVKKSVGDYFSEMVTRVKGFFTGFFSR